MFDQLQRGLIDVVCTAARRRPSARELDYGRPFLDTVRSVVVRQKCGGIDDLEAARGRALRRAECHDR